MIIFTWFMYLLLVVTLVAGGHMWIKTRIDLFYFPGYIKWISCFYTVITILALIRAEPDTVYWMLLLTAVIFYIATLISWVLSTETTGLTIFAVLVAFWFMLDPNHFIPLYGALNG